MAKPTVLFVATTFPTSLKQLTPHFLHTLAEGLSTQFEVHVLAPHIAGAEVFEQFDDLNVHRFRYAPPPLEKLAYGSGIVHNIKAQIWLVILVPFFVLSALFKAVSLILKYKIKLVHVNWIIPFGPLFAILKDLFNYQLIVTALGADLLDVPNSKSFKKSGLQRLMAWSVKHADAVTVLSSPMKQRIQTLTACNSIGVHVIPLGIDVNRFSVAQRNVEPNGRLKLLFVGRLVEVKGCDLLIEALALIREAKISFTCTIAGDGHDRSVLEKRCESLGLEDVVTFLGHVHNQNVPQLMANHSIFVVPSRREAFGVVYLEAMASGLAIISTKTDGQFDLITNAREGFVVENESPIAIANAVVSFAKKRELITEMGSAGVAQAAKFNWPTVCARYIHLYHSLLPKT